MKIYSVYSPSHKVLYDQYFIKTIPKNFQLNIVEEPEQVCKKASYHSAGWTDICRQKVDIFLSACKENFGKHFFYCDVDVQFFGDNLLDSLIEEIQDYDLACQDDVYGYNSGVFVCKANDATLKLFTLMKERYVHDDQKTLNAYINLCKHKKLSHRFFNVGQIFKSGWKGQDFVVPINMLLHHANWVVGVNKKIKLLNIVRNKYDTGNIF